MITLWILVILTILAVSIGHRVSLALRVSRYQQDRLKAYCLARAGTQRAIVELENDKNEEEQYDSLSDSWSTGIAPLTNKQFFENIEIQEGSGETFSLKYPYEKDSYSCMVDEESKININTAPEQLLLTLFKELNMEDADAQQLTKDIRIWRGDNEPRLGADAAYYINFKKKPFVVPEEIMVILENFYQNKSEENYQRKAQDMFEAIRYLITAYPYEGEAKININTASERVLTILAKSVAEPTGEQFVDGLITKIINFRRGDKGPFKEEGAPSDFKNNELRDDKGQNIFGDMAGSFLTVQSNYFAIGSTGNVGRISRKITAIYNRRDKKIVYWHEN